MGLFDKIFGKKEPQRPAMTQQDMIFEMMKSSLGITGDERLSVDGPSNPNYGLCAENPVFVRGPAGTSLYLGRLKTAMGQQLRWERVGSTDAPGVPGKTDIYVGKLADGTEYMTIFVNWYRNQNSTTAPRGLKL